jgi:hypothetical protein
LDHTPDFRRHCVALGGEHVAEARAVEVASANGLLRRGWTRDTVKTGDVITIRGFAARDGTRTGNAAAVIRTSTGESLYASSGDGSAD